MTETLEVSEWKAAPGFYACIPGEEEHDHPASHPWHHRMGRPPRTDPLKRHCLERDCSYLERRELIR